MTAAPPDRSTTTRVVPVLMVVGTTLVGVFGGLQALATLLQAVWPCGETYGCALAHPWMIPVAWCLTLAMPTVCWVVGIIATDPRRAHPLRLATIAFLTAVGASLGGSALLWTALATTTAPAP